MTVQSINQSITINSLFLAGDAFVRINHRAIAICSFVCPSVRLSSIGRACIVIIRCTFVGADLSLWLDSPMFWEP